MRIENCPILIVANDYTTLYNFRLELLQRLVAEKYTVVVALPHDDRNGAFVRLGCQVSEIPLSRFGTNPIADFKTFLAIRKLIRSIRPLAVFTYTAKANIYGALACRVTGTPCICNVTGLGANLQKKSLIGSIMLKLQKAAYKKATMVFCQNPSNLQFLKEQGVLSDKTPCEVLPGSGVNLADNPYEPLPEETPDRKLRFITIARIRQDKGYDELFSAIRTLNGAADFHIVGWYEDDSYKPIVEEMQSKFGVKFYENMPHEKVHGLIRECDCLIHPSHHEGMSNVILEAAAAGRPCIVSDIPGCKEGIDDGVSGLTFAVKDAVSLQNAITKFLSLSTTERNAMSRAARKKMETQFDREFVINRYLDVVKGL